MQEWQTANTSADTTEVLLECLTSQCQGADVQPQTAAHLQQPAQMFEDIASCSCGEWGNAVDEGRGQKCSNDGSIKLS